MRAENETRTRDPNLGKVVLYQLSYFRNIIRACMPVRKTFAKVCIYPHTTKFFTCFLQPAGTRRVQSGADANPASPFVFLPYARCIHQSVSHTGQWARSRKICSGLRFNNTADRPYPLLLRTM